MMRVRILVIGEDYKVLRQWAQKTTGIYYSGQKKVVVGGVEFFLRTDAELDQVAGYTFDAVLHAGRIPEKVLAYIRRTPE